MQYSILMIIQEFFQVFELQIGMNEFDHRSFLSLLKQQRERPEKFILNFSGLSCCCFTALAAIKNCDDQIHSIFYFVYLNSISS